ncbi:MAG: Cys-Xaa-Xaa-Xaa repeat radical SAM target protein [Bacteroidaceae bacterium]|nr:Cys-Xaa-Xaa-Xaa repeat radical SAM target protein [Bacteroidaceae bacterium]
MEKKELQSRREFFKSAAKGVLPFLGLTILQPIVLTSCSKDCDSCNNSCSDACITSCKNTCEASCETGCEGSCETGCKGTCASGCYGCKGTCIAGCKGIASRN